MFQRISMRRGSVDNVGRLVAQYELSGVALLLRLLHDNTKPFDVYGHPLRGLIGKASGGRLCSLDPLRIASGFRHFGEQIFVHHDLVLAPERTIYITKRELIMRNHAHSMGLSKIFDAPKYRLITGIIAM
jgi:hypothetical protein